MIVFIYHLFRVLQVLHVLQVPLGPLVSVGTWVLLRHSVNADALTDTIGPRGT